MILTELESVKSSYQSYLSCGSKIYMNAIRFIGDHTKKRH